MYQLTGLEKTTYAAHSLSPTCPECNNPVTVEETEYFKSIICEHCFDYCVINHYEDCCKHPNLSSHKLIISGGGIQVRKQCGNCGYLSGVSLGGLTKEEREALPPVDEYEREAYLKRVADAKGRHWDRIRQHREMQHSGKTSDWWRKYNAYLKTDVWHKKRVLVLHRDKHLCQSCLTHGANQAHHTSYQHVDFMGSEPLFEIVSVCYQCHEKIHSLRK